MLEHKKEAYRERKGKIWLAMVLSATTLIGGHIYNDQTDKGWFLLFFFIGFSIFSLGWLVWLCIIADSYVDAVRWNETAAYRMGLKDKPHNYLTVVS